MITHFAQHLVDRYGIDEVAQWYFEVWNEPNIDFWNGIPRDKKSYFELYDHTARALKAVSPRLRVGGPATAAAHWVDDFLKYACGQSRPGRFCFHARLCRRHRGKSFRDQRRAFPMDDRVCRAVAKVQKTNSSHPGCRTCHCSGPSGMCPARWKSATRPMSVPHWQIPFASAMGLWT